MWSKKKKGISTIHTLKGIDVAIVQSPVRGIVFNGTNYDSLEQAKREAEAFAGCQQKGGV